MARSLGNIPLETLFIQAFCDNLQYMRRRGEYSAILHEYGRRFAPGEQLAVYWYDDIRSRPAGLLREIMTFLDIDPAWQSDDLQVVVGASPEPSVIGAEDAAEVTAYYAPFDGELRSLLGVTTLPWSTAPSESPVARRSSGPKLEYYRVLSMVAR